MSLAAKELVKSKYGKIGSSDRAAVVELQWLTKHYRNKTFQLLQVEMDLQ